MYEKHKRYKHIMIPNISPMKSDCQMVWKYLGFRTRKNTKNHKAKSRAPKCTYMCVMFFAFMPVNVHVLP